MKYLYLTLTILLLTAFSCALEAQPRMAYKAFGRREGISQEQITGIAFDSSGFAWMTTKTGINRFDGLRFENFLTGRKWIKKRTERPSIDPKNGLVWTYIRNTILKQPMKLNGSFTKYQLNDSLTIEYMTVTNDGVPILFVHPPGNWERNQALAYDASLDSFLPVAKVLKKWPSGLRTYYAFPFGNSKQLLLYCIDKSVWLWGADGALQRLELPKTTFNGQEAQYWFQKGADGHIYMRMTNGQLSELFKLEGSRFRSLPIQVNFGFNYMAVRTESEIFFSDSEHRIWSWEGKGASPTFTGIKLKLVSSMEFAHEGTLFIGNEDVDQTLICITPIHRASRVFEFGKSGLPSNVWAVGEAANGDMYFGAYNNPEAPFTRYSHPKKTFDKIESVPGMDYHFGSKVLRDKSLLFVTSNGLKPLVQVSITGKELVPVQNANPENGTQFGLAQDRRTGNIFLGRAGVIEVYSEKFEHLHDIVLDAVSKYYIMDISQAPDGGIYAVGGPSNLFRIDPLSFHVDTIFDFAFKKRKKMEKIGFGTVSTDKNGRIWLSEFFGQYVYEPWNKSLKKWGSETPFLEGFINEMIDDSTLLIGARNGTYLLNTEEYHRSRGSKISNIWIPAGSGSLEPVTQEGISFGQDGRKLVLCQASQAEVVDMETWKNKFKGVKAVQARIELITYEDNTRKKYYLNEDSLALAPEIPLDAYSVEVSLAAPNFQNLGNYRFIYGIEANGKIARWDTSYSTVFVLENIPSGRNKLWVKSLDPFGRPVGQAFYVPLRKAYPWYLQWWAIIGGALLLAAAIFTGVSRYLHTERLKLEKQEEENELIKAMNLSLNNQLSPHLVRTVLIMEMTAMSKMLRNKQFSDAEIKIMMEKNNQISKFLQGLFLDLYNSTEVFRTVSDERLFVEKFVRIAQLVHVHVKVDWEWDTGIETEDILLPKMSLQTLVNNSFLHAFPENGNTQAPLIIIRLVEESAFYRVEVEDNGVGMDYEVPENEKKEKSGRGIKINRQILDYENSRNGLKNQLTHEKSRLFETGTLATIHIDKRNVKFIAKLP